MHKETEPLAFMHRLEGAGVWLDCGKRLLDSLAPSVMSDLRFSVILHPVHLAVKAVSVAASFSLTVVFSSKMTNKNLMFFLN